MEWGNGHKKLIIFQKHHHHHRSYTVIVLQRIEIHKILYVRVYMCKTKKGKHKIGLMKTTIGFVVLFIHLHTDTCLIA